MRRSSRVDAKGALLAHCQQWTEIVELFAMREDRRFHVDPRGYQTLHHELIEMCRRETEQLSPAARAAVRELEEMADPWISLDSLAHADADVVYDLFQRCLRVQGALDDRAKRKRLWKRVGLGLGAVVLLAFAGWGLVKSFQMFAPARQWVSETSEAVCGSPSGVMLLVAGVGTSAALILIVWRATSEE